MTEETQGAEQAPAATNDAGQAPTVDPAEYAALLARAKKLEADLSKSNADAAAKRVAARDANEEKLKALEAKGEYEEAAKMKDARIAELEALLPKAERWDAFESQQQEKVAAALEADDLPDYLRTAVTATSDVVQQLAILQGYRDSIAAAQPPSPPKPPAGPAGSGTSVGGSKDWAALNAAGGQKLQQAIQEDPTGWSAFLSGNTKRTKPSF